MDKGAKQKKISLCPFQFTVAALQPFARHKSFEGQQSMSIFRAGPQSFRQNGGVFIRLGLHAQLLRTAGTTKFAVPQFGKASRNHFSIGQQVPQIAMINTPWKKKSNRLPGKILKDEILHG
jgi:hypothetical protein